MRDFESGDLDGLLVVMLTYGPAMRVAGALAHTRLPVCLANVQPVPAVTPEWDMADLTYNQGIHGAQDTANAMVRAGRPFHVVTGDWHEAAFADSIGGWARAAAAVTRWRRLRVAVFGYAMNGMGDIRVDVHTFLRTLGPQVDALAPGELWRAMGEVGADEVAALIADEDARFEVDPRLSAEEREDHARMQLALRHVLDAGGYGAYSTHFGAIAEDGRFARLPLAAASSLMSLGLRLRRRGRRADRGADGRRGRPARPDPVHRDVRDGLPERLDPDEPHGGGQPRARPRGPPGAADQAPAGIGGLDDPPTFLFQYRPGPATLAALVALGGDRFRLVVSEGEVLATDELPALEMPYGFFRPDSGVRDCMDAWLRLGGPHHQVLNPGRHGASWRMFCEAAGIEFATA